jgi:glycosyltransferase involved in cell wall biosynthesis
MGIDDLILFTGFFSDVTQLLHTSDLYVSHSQSEALGISILEALACGLPVVATDSGGPSEIVNEDNGVGILVDKNDAEGYARAIVKMITDRDFYDSCRKRTKSLVQSRFSLDHMADETFKVYQAVTDSRR